MPVERHRIPLADVPSSPIFGRMPRAADTSGIDGTLRLWVHLGPQCYGHFSFGMVCQFGNVASSPSRHLPPARYGVTQNTKLLVNGLMDEWKQGIRPQLPTVVLTVAMAALISCC